jgi:alpha-aminoadipic semialdehyde synthase
MIDFLRGLGQRFLSLGFSTPFLEMGSTYMYPDLDAAKGAVRCGPRCQEFELH